MRRKMLSPAWEQAIGLQPCLSMSRTLSKEEQLSFPILASPYGLRKELPLSGTIFSATGRETSLHVTLPVRSSPAPSGFPTSGFTSAGKRRVARVARIHSSESLHLTTASHPSFLPTSPYPQPLVPKILE